MTLRLRLKAILREIQLSLSLGVVALIVFAVSTAAIVLHLPALGIENNLARVVLAALLGRGLLLVICPALAYGSAYLFGTGPWGASVGTVLFVEIVLIFNEWVRGGLDEDQAFWSHQAPLWVVSGVAMLLGFVAAEAGARRGAARDAAESQGKPTPESTAAAFAEQMRAAQERARPPQPATPATPPSLPPPAGASPPDPGPAAVAPPSSGPSATPDAAPPLPTESSPPPSDPVAPPKQA